MSAKKLKVNYIATDLSPVDLILIKLPFSPERPYIYWILEMSLSQGSISCEY